MSTKTESRIKIFSAFGSLFSKGIDIEDSEDTKLSSDLLEVLKALSPKEKAVEQSINVTGSTSKKSELGKKTNPIKDANTEKAMRAMLNKKEIKNSIEEDKERE